jgi:hypothetical protein
VDTDLWGKIDDYFKRSDIDGAVQFLENLLEREPASQFKGLLGGPFSNPPGAILDAVNQFIETCQKQFDLKAVYLEMNGFDINYDRWYFDFFGYSEGPDEEDDFDWLSHWQSKPWPQTTLEGLESVQKDFEWYDKNKIWETKEYEKPRELAVLLVMAKFVALIQAAIGAGPLAKPILVLATAHDFDIIGRVAESSVDEMQREGPKRHDLGRIIEELRTGDRKVVSEALGKLYTRVPAIGPRQTELLIEVLKLASEREQFAPNVRQMAVMVLPLVGPTDPGSKVAVLAAFDDPSPFVRRQALEAMISFPSHAESDLIRIKAMENDIDKSVASWSEIALRNIRLNSKKTRHQRPDG